MSLRKLHVGILRLVNFFSFNWKIIWRVIACDEIILGIWIFYYFSLVANVSLSLIVTTFSKILSFVTVLCTIYSTAVTIREKQQSIGYKVEDAPAKSIPIRPLWVVWVEIQRDLRLQILFISFLFFFYLNFLCSLVLTVLEPSPYYYFFFLSGYVLDTDVRLLAQYPRPTQAWRCCQLYKL